MNSTTLKGIFPEPKQPHKKNFIKENMRHIKQLQSYVQQEGSTSQVRDERYRNVSKSQSSYASQSNAPSRIGTSKSRTKASDQKSSSQETSEKAAQPAKKTVTKPTQTRPKNKLSNKPTLEIRQLRDFGEIYRKEDIADYHPVEKEKITHRGIQTERNNDVNKIYDSGIIKYPSPSIIDELSSSRRQSGRRNDNGDSAAVDEKLHQMKITENDKPDYIRQNIQSLKGKTSKLESPSHPNNLPSNYQKGVVPKYLKERKEEQQAKVEPADVDCPPGHVQLPDDERKETLRVLRQSYADRIQELNSMPVRNDTLKMRKRKIEIEEELKKIDEGIKVFQRPKVFVKING